MSHVCTLVKVTVPADNLLFILVVFFKTFDDRKAKSLGAVRIDFDVEVARFV